MYFVYLLCTYLDTETELVERERLKAETINTNLRRQIEDFIVPDVIDYVQVRADLYDLNKTLRTWERKVDIAQVRTSFIDVMENLAGIYFKKRK